MKGSLLCFVVTLCAATFMRADQDLRALQQALKEQGFYYGAVTGDNNAETIAAIRRYQIRNGLKVTGEMNEETLRSVSPSLNSVASTLQSASKPAAIQPNSTRPDARAPRTQSPGAHSFSEANRPMQTNPSYSPSFYESVPLRLNPRVIAAAQYELMSRGFFSGRVDGRWGARTAFAVRAFQSSAGLPATGGLDIETVKALGSSAADVLAYSQ